MFFDWIRTRTQLHGELDITRKGMTWLLQKILASSHMDLVKEVRAGLKTAMLEDEIIVEASKLPKNLDWFVHFLLLHFAEVWEGRGKQDMAAFSAPIMGTDQHMEVIFKAVDSPPTAEVLNALNNDVDRVLAALDYLLQEFVPHSPGTERKLCELLDLQDGPRSANHLSEHLYESWRKAQATSEASVRKKGCHSCRPPGETGPAVGDGPGEEKIVDDKR